MFWLPFVSAKKSPRLMRPAASAVAASRPLARAIALPRSTTSLRGVSGGLRVRRRRLHDAEQRGVLLDQRLDVGIEVGRRHPELVGPPNTRRQRIGEVLVGAHDLDAREVDGLPRQVRQRFLGIDLRPAGGEDGAELAQRAVVHRDCRRLLFGERDHLGRGGRHEAKTDSAECNQNHNEDNNGNAPRPPHDGLGLYRRPIVPHAYLVADACIHYPIVPIAFAAPATAAFRVKLLRE